MTVLIEAQNVEARYGPVLALRGVSLLLREAEVVAVLGANGAGKTTLLRILCAALDPDQGSVKFLGRDIAGSSPDRLVRQGLAHVPEGREVFPLLSVRENLIAGAFVRRDRAAIAADVDRMYGYFPALRERRDRHAAVLSGGEQQMLAIARALMSRPRVLMLDEPSLGLAPALVKEIFTLLRRINRESGVSILLVEQNAHQALSIADRGYVLELGRIVLDDWSERLAANDDVRESYLGIRDKGLRGERRWRRKKRWR
ncbi:MAG: ABC transporter ATP-binding protein [Betaproteobacteria bacterium]|nr:MAG: ABC transporter ATP-binding protein [Betaproteobacteria bacterium]